MKKIYLILLVATVLFGCGENTENAQLKSQVDSLNNIINQKLEAEATLERVGVLLDSIDVSRHGLGLIIVEGITYADYIDRLKTINEHIKDSQDKIAALESSLKKSKNVSATTIKRLKTDLEARSREIIDLQLEVVALREENNSKFMKLAKRDSMISARDEVIRLKNSHLTSLETLIQDVNEQNKIKVANLYFAQAEALETAADRTQFAPRKKKEARREALELYRLSLSMGNDKALDKVNKLEKELS